MLASKDQQICCQLIIVLALRLARAGRAGWKAMMWALLAVLAQLSQGKVEDVVTDRGLGAKSHHTHQEIAKAGDWDESFRRLG
eukprot:s425_g4.t1